MVVIWWWWWWERRNGRREGKRKRKQPREKDKEKETEMKRETENIIDPKTRIRIKDYCRMAQCNQFDKPTVPILATSNVFEFPFRTHGEWWLKKCLHCCVSQIDAQKVLCTGSFRAQRTCRNTGSRSEKQNCMVCFCAPHQCTTKQALRLNRPNWNCSQKPHTKSDMTASPHYENHRPNDDHDKFERALVKRGPAWSCRNGSAAAFDHALYSFGNDFCLHVNS